MLLQQALGLIHFAALFETLFFGAAAVEVAELS
jgi:hypothetical protein